MLLKRITLSLLWAILCSVVLSGAAPEKQKETPNAVIMRKCNSVLETIDSSKMTIKGFYHDNTGTKNDFLFDGVIDFPGNADGAIKLSGGKMSRDGSIRTVNGRTFYLAKGDDKWFVLPKNTYNSIVDNDLFRVTALLQTLLYYPEYLIEPVFHEDVLYKESKADYLKIVVNIDKLRKDSSNDAQPSKLKYFASELTGKKAIAEVWIDKKSNYLLELKIDIDGYGKSKKPLSGNLVLSDFNIAVKIKRPTNVYEYAH